MSEMTILRDACNADMQAITEIYADEVINGVSSWEAVPPSCDEMRQRHHAIINGGYPFRVADIDGLIAGYAYAAPYRPRLGYRYTVENTIYLCRECRGIGVGRRLLEDLIAICENRGYRQMIAVIGDSSNRVSIDFHSRMGFVKAGVIKSIGFKHGRWLDSVVMQRTLGEGDQSLPV